MSNLEGLARLLLRSEDATFELFSRASSQSLELQGLDELLCELRGKGSYAARLQQQQQQAVESLLPSESAAASVRNAQQRRRASLGSLEDALALKSVAALRLEAGLAERRGLLSSIRTATEELLIATGSHKPSTSCIAAADGSLGISSVLTALGCVELRAQRLLNSYAALLLLADRELQPQQQALLTQGPAALAAGERTRQAAVELLGSGPNVPFRSAGFSDVPALSDLPEMSPASARGGDSAEGMSRGGPEGAIFMDSGDDGAFVRPMTILDIRRKAKADISLLSSAAPAKVPMPLSQE